MTRVGPTEARDSRGVLLGVLEGGGEGRKGEGE